MSLEMFTVGTYQFTTYLHNEYTTELHIKLQKDTETDSFLVTCVIIVLNINLLLIYHMLNPLLPEFFFRSFL